MRREFRTGLFFGIFAALAIALYCFWLWEGERQVARHTENLFRRIEQKKWSGLANLIADDYRDQWNNDRGLLLERMRLVLGAVRDFRINATDIDIECKIDNGTGGNRAPSTGKPGRIGVWRGKILIEIGDAEFGAVVKEQINSLTAPFELQWRCVSGKPWDWKLIRVSNPDLEIPKGFD